MTINKFNYEAYALDYLEGTLSPKLTVEMERFLELHPAIEAELSGLRNLVYLEPDSSEVFESKAALLKPESKSNLTTFWIRPLAIAAGIALLLGVFTIGYQAGQERGNASEKVVKVVTPTPKKLEIPVASSPKEAAPSIAQSDLSKKIEEPLINIPNHKQKTTKRKPGTLGIIERLSPITTLENVTANAKSSSIEEDEKVLNPTQPLFEEDKKTTVLNKLETVSFKSENLLVHSINDTLPGLQRALTTNLSIDYNRLSANQKKRRSFKDLLGKFPIGNLKEALIPSYYKEEDTGE